MPMLAVGMLEVGKISVHKRGIACNFFMSIWSVGSPLPLEPSFSFLSSSYMPLRLPSAAHLRRETDRHYRNIPV